MHDHLSMQQPSTHDEQGPRFDAEQFVRHLTHKPGVYQMLDCEGRVLYVGKARDLKRRVASYFQGRAHDAKTLALLKLVANVEVTVTPTETEALMLEYNLIKRHRPRFNVVLRDDKSYPYIHVSTDQDFPRLSFYRGPRSKAGRLFGPYPNAGSVRETLNQLHKLFQLRQCEDSYFANRTRPCLQYQLKRCTAPCVGLISQEEYARDVEHAVLFLEGASDAVSRSLAQRMERAAEQLDFERAAQYRDQLAKLKRVQAVDPLARSSGDFDAVGMAAEHGVYCVSVMFFRGGRSLGSRSHFPRVSPGTDEEEVIRAFLLQYYAGREAPRELLVGRSVPEADVLEAMLSERSGRRVQIKWRVRGARRRWLDMALANARHGAAQRYQSSSTMSAQLEALAETLELESAPTRLECFDISHTGGEATVASCVVFGPEGPLKSDYRRFNISGVAARDDYAALTQALERRFSGFKVRMQEAVHDHGRNGKGASLALPDVLFIDGGRGQLVRARDVLGELGLDVRLVAIAKGEGRRPGREKLYVPERREPLRLPASSPALHLIQQVRDEAHRFAIAGHRARRRKRQRSSPLEQISGLGPKRRRALLTHFGGLQGVARAGVEELASVRGISRGLAQSIYEQFHSD